MIGKRKENEAPMTRSKRMITPRPYKRKAGNQTLRWIRLVLIGTIVFAFLGCQTQGEQEEMGLNEENASTESSAYFISAEDGAAIAKALVTTYAKAMAPYDKWGNMWPEDITDPVYRQDVEDFRERYVDPKAFLLCAGEYLHANEMDIRILAADMPYLKEYMEDLKRSFNTRILYGELTDYIGNLYGLYRFSEEYPRIFQAMKNCQPDRLILDDCTYEDLDAFISSEIDFKPFLNEVGSFIEDEDKEVFEWKDTFIWTESMLKDYYGGNSYGAMTSEANTILLATWDDSIKINSMAEWIQSVWGDVSFTLDPDCASLIIYNSLYYENYSYSNTNGSGSTKNVKVGNYIIIVQDAVTGEQLGEYRVSGSAPGTISNTDASDSYYLPADLDTDTAFAAFLNGLKDAE